ncbi:MAG TPA: universal stress protein [Chitinophagaceae bacterium]|nr:universal stress protein [Chitinophagaceae bacterium]
MNKVIVPVDFSETSLNAARYAAALCSGYPGVKIMLYHLSESESDAADAPDKIDELCKQLSAGTDLSVDGKCVLGHGFVEHLEILVKSEQADLVVMGITPRSELAQKFVSSNALKMAGTGACPVLIVQETAEYKGLNNVMLASDLQNTYYSTPAESIKKFLATFNPSLHIVNVNSDHYIALTEHHEKEKKALMAHFEEFNPEFYFLRFFDVEEGLHLFAEEKSIDLIISIQRDHPLIERLFKPSQTKNMTYKGNVPVLVVHEEKA